MGGEFADQSVCSAPLLAPSSTLEQDRQWRDSPRVLIPAFTVAGIVVAIVHHELYVSLDGTRVDAKFGPYGQTIVPALGTSIAFIGHTVLAAAIGIAFVQVFWWRLRKGRYSIKHIGALVSCHKSPFTPSSFPAWSLSTILAVAIAALANFMTVITIFAPAALSIISGYESLPCQVRVPLLTTASSGGIKDATSSDVIAFTTKAVIEGYLPPFKQCDRECYFDVTYSAPALSCSNTTHSVNFTSVLPSDTLWNSTYQFNNSGLFIDAAMVTNAATGQMSAVACTAYNATYAIRITNSVNSSTVIPLAEPLLLNPITNSGSDPSAVAMGLLVNALANAVSGTISRAHFSWGGSIIQFTWMAYGAYYLNQTQDLMWMLRSMAKNISLSVPSGFLDFNDNPSAMVPFTTTCGYSANVYTYNQKHLLLAYGSCLLVTLLCSLFAIVAIQDGGNEFLDFARMLEAIPAYGLGSNLKEDTYFTVEKKLFGVAQSDVPP